MSKAVKVARPGQPSGWPDDPDAGKRAWRVRAALLRRGVTLKEVAERSSDRARVRVSPQYVSKVIRAPRCHGYKATMVRTVIAEVVGAGRRSR